MAFTLGLFVILALVLVLLLGRFRALQSTIDKLTERVATLERREKAELQPVAPAKPAIPPSPLLVRKPSPPPSAPICSVPAPVAAAASARASINWEAFMGVKLFAWLGGLALFLGIVFLVKYSFENNLITPLGRVVIGGLTGAGLVCAGWWLARGRYRTTAESLCATGIVILYADLYAAHSFYRLISLTTAFFAMSAVTLFSFFLAVGLDAQVVVLLGLLGGFLTPALLPSGNDQAPSLFAYVGLLDCGVAAVALRKGWFYLVLLAAIGSAAMQIAWAAQFFDSSKGGRAFWIFLGAEALFLGFFFLRKPAGKWLAAAAGLAGFTAVGFAFWITAVPPLARRPIFFLGFTFLAQAGLLALPVIGRAWRGIGVAANAIVFALLAEWIAIFSPDLPLATSLGAIACFALLQAVSLRPAVTGQRPIPLGRIGAITPFLLLIALIERANLAGPEPIFGLAFLLAVILLATAIIRRSDWMAGAALLGTGLVELTWQNDRFTAGQAMPALIGYALFLVLFVAFPFCSAEKNKTEPWAISALAQALQFWLCYAAITSTWPNDRMGLLPAAFIVPPAISVLGLLRFYAADPATGDARLAWQGGALLLFVSLIFPLQFHREWITLGWAIEGLALLLLFRRVPHRGLRLVGAGLLCAAFARLALNPAVFNYHKRTGVRIWNWYVYAYGITTAALLGSAAFFGAALPTPWERFAPKLLGSLGAILAFLLLNIEIADYFSIGPTLTFSFSGNFARDMTYSIAWALFALVVILIGMRLKQRLTRYAGLALLGVTLAKLFLHDLSDLTELYRIGAFVGVALILIAASFLYQRFLVPERAAK